MPRPAGLPKTGGRKKGSLNKATADVKEAAQEFTADAINTLATIMRDSEAPHAARVSAASAILDRGHGKPKQAVDIEANVAVNDVSSEPETSEAEWSAQHGM